MRLRSLQSAFARGVLGGEGRLAVRGGGTLSPQAALAVYRDGYYARLTEALGETYEGVWSVLGDEDFFAACRAYIAKHPSPFYNLSDYGREFGGFLTKRHAAKEFPFLNELCRFEWAFKELFHKKQHLSLPPKALAEINGRSRLVFGEAVGFRRHEYSVYQVWKRRESRAALPRGEWEKPESLLLYKQDGRIFVKELHEGELRVLESLGAGRPLAESLAVKGLDAKRASGLFSIVAETGIVAGIK